MQAYRFYPGCSPLLLSIPHAGTCLPKAIAGNLTGAASHLPDTDWHVDTLYAFANAVGAHVIRANYSRYAVDLNRPPDDTRLYAGPTTGLFPDVLFDGRPLFRDGAFMDRSQYLEQIWRPYHARIRQTLDALKQAYGYAVLFDAHSIRSVVPRLFDGTLPDLNIGTNNSQSLDPAMEARLSQICNSAKGYTMVVNGRFKGGYTTRHYGDPSTAIHAVQLELVQSTYMDEHYPFTYRADKAKRLQRLLRALLNELLAWCPIR